MGTVGITSHCFFIGSFYLAVFQSNNKTDYMNDLIDRLIKEAKLSPEQAKKAIETIADFVKEKFPMLGGAVDNIFSAGSKDDE